MSAADFLLEIGCEEIPARMLPGAAADLASCVTQVLQGGGLDHGDARTFCTPRRLAVIVKNVALRQQDRDEEVTGPPVRSAFDAAGKPTRAAVGFAQKMGVDVSALATIPTAKGDYLGVKRHVPGKDARDLLAEALPRAISGISFPKSMRWGDGTRRFVRPVHWITALLGGEIVPLEVFAVKAGRTSAGHRVIGVREVAIPSPAQYESLLLAQGIAADRDERRRAVSRRLVELAGEEGVRPVEDPELLEEVADLVEHPAAVLGSFPLEFLELPREVLVTTLRHHQKAFATETDEGLSHRFLVVADIDQDAQGFIRKGNEWVVMGRLEDARFFFLEDRKLPFAARCEKLAHVTFHARAGSYKEKGRRVEAIAVALAEIVNGARSSRPGAAQSPSGAPSESPRIDLDALRTAARLAKCDLTTGLVGEFPELQGIAGGLYVALEAKSGLAAHPPGTAEAIYDQYRPAGAKDALPRTPEGALLALADRLDSLAALARCVGLPTGSKDPFGLRRAAFGAIRIVAETPLPLSLHDMVETAAASVEDTIAAGREGADRQGILQFLIERLEFLLKENTRYDTLNAVVMRGSGTPATVEPVPQLIDKIRALESFRDQPDIAALIEIHKRCRNILDQAAAIAETAVLEAGGKKDAQEADTILALETRIQASEASVGAFSRGDQFRNALVELVRIRPYLSEFFDRVLVMDVDPAARKRKLELVRRTTTMIEEVADLKQISISKEELQRLRAQMRTIEG